MRSASFWAGAAGILFTGLAASAPSLAQQYVPAQAHIGNAAAVGNASQPGAKPKSAADKPAAKPATQVATAAAAQPAATTAPSHAPAATSGAPQVFLLKGLADVFSSGLDKLAERLRARGVVGQVASHAQWDTLADAAIARYRAGQRGAIVVAGHSLGADAAVDFANRLYAAKVPVALVMTFGPLQFRPVMGNVSRAVNYFQANSAWHGQILRGKDFKGSLTNVQLDNAPDVNHFNIEKVDRIQFEAVNRIVAAVGGGGPRKAPAPAATASGEAAPATTSTTTEQKPADGTAAAGAATAAPAKEN